MVGFYQILLIYLIFMLISTYLDRAFTRQY